MTQHYEMRCKHDVLMGQCRCPSPSKEVRRVACGDACEPQRHPVFKDDCPECRTRHPNGWVCPKRLSRTEDERDEAERLLRLAYAKADDEDLGDESLEHLREGHSTSIHDMSIALDMVVKGFRDRIAALEDQRGTAENLAVERGRRIDTLEADRETLIDDIQAVRNDKERFWREKTTLEAENERLRALLLPVAEWHDRGGYGSVGDSASGAILEWLHEQQEATPTEEPVVATPALCRIEGCEKVATFSDWCEDHVPF